SSSVLSATSSTPEANSGYDAAEADTRQTHQRMRPGHALNPDRGRIAFRNSRRPRLLVALVLLALAGPSPAREAKPPVDRSPSWAFKPLTLPAVPAVGGPALSTRLCNPIDTFVTAKLLERGLTPSPEADRRT